MLLITDLPPEIRNTINELVLANDSKDGLLVRHRHYFELSETRRALTQTCRQMRTESLPVYYFMNTFQLSSLRDLTDWLAVVGKNCQYLRSLHFPDGVMEGRPWKTIPPSPALNLVDFSMRISSNDALTALATKENVKEEMEDIVFKAIKGSRRVMRRFGSYDLVLTGRMSHCLHCAEGTCRFCLRQRCCYRR